MAEDEQKNAADAVPPETLRRYVDEVTKATRVYLKTPEGKHSCYITGDEIPGSETPNNRTVVKDYYVQYLKDHPETEMVSVNMERLREEYIEKAIELAKQSEQKDKERYVNPLNLNVESNKKNFEKNIKTEVEKAEKNETVLPALHEPEDWKNVYEAIYATKDQQIKTEQGSSVAPNHVVNALVSENPNNDRNEVHMVVNPSLTVRAVFSKKIKTQPNPSDIIKMTDYLRILRRFHLLSQLKDGKAVAHVNCTNVRKFELVHPYLQRMEDTEGSNRFANCMKIQDLQIMSSIGNRN